MVFTSLDQFSVEFVALALEKLFSRVVRIESEIEFSFTLFQLLSLGVGMFEQ